MPEGWPGTEVGWSFRRAAWGQGYATEAATAAIDWAFAQLGWDDVIHCIAPENVASQARCASASAHVTAGPRKLPDPYRRRSRSRSGDRSRDQWRRDAPVSDAITVYGYRPRATATRCGCCSSSSAGRIAGSRSTATRGETRTPEFLAQNPNGSVPCIELGDGRVLAESNAILCCLADGTPYFAGDAWQRAQALQWMFFEQYSHEPYVAVARFICGWTPLDQPRARRAAAAASSAATRRSAVMEQHLGTTRWFSRRPTTASPTSRCIAYTHVRGGRWLRAGTLSRDPRLARARARDAAVRGDAGAGGGECGADHVIATKAGITVGGASAPTAAWSKRHAVGAEALLRIFVRHASEIDHGRCSKPDPRAHERRQPRRGLRRELHRVRARLDRPRRREAGARTSRSSTAARSTRRASASCSSRS